MKKTKDFVKEEKGITLAVLVITIIILLILSTVLLMSFDEVDVLNATKDNIKTYKTNREETSEEVDEMVTNLDAKNRTGLSVVDIEKITNKIKNGSLQELSYSPSETSTSITIEGIYNGGVADQTFTQTSLGARDLKWYVLSADSNGLNLVSDVTSAPVTFKDSAGYDNCLYYLNELSTKLFTNSEQFGVDSSRVHALRLTDIKKAAEQVNEGENWSWNDTFIKNAPSDSNSGLKVWNEGNVGQRKFSPTNKYYPALYTANSEKQIIVNNSLYDENPGRLIKNDSGIKREVENDLNPATNMEYNYTYFGYYNNTQSMLANLSSFATSGIGQELFKSATNGSYYLASRCIRNGGSYAYYHLRQVGDNGHLDTVSFCLSNGTVYEMNKRFRVVVSIPTSHFDVSQDGTVTLK